MEPAPLLPKLRGKIAEFLNEVSLTRLSIFYSPTCVGLRYGQPWEHLVAFLDTSFNRSGSAEASPSLLLRADRHFQSAACLYSCVTTKLNHSRCRNIKPALHRLRPPPRPKFRPNLGGRTLPQKPLVFGGQGFFLAFCLFIPHSSLLTLQLSFP